MPAEDTQNTYRLLRCLTEMQKNRNNLEEKRRVARALLKAVPRAPRPGPVSTRHTLKHRQLPRALPAEEQGAREGAVPPEDNCRRISFMNNDAGPHASLLLRMRAGRRDSAIYGPEEYSPEKLPSTVSQQIDLYDSYMSSLRSDSLGGNETILLDMVRRNSREAENEIQGESLELSRDDVSDDPSGEACVHGLSMRTTERSVSRSRFSRISTRRDMDIPSILAFTTTTAPAPVALENPAFKKMDTAEQENIPRWSVRRALCPVCSQKWRDRSSVTNVKYSGLKRNSSSDLPTVIAPARLRASITTAYVPCPALRAVDLNAATDHGPLRNSSATWQFTRARRFRVPKPQLPPPEAAAPPSSTAPMAQKDLDLRVHKFLNDALLFNCT